MKTILEVLKSLTISGNLLGSECLSTGNDGRTDVVSLALFLGTLRK